MPTHPTANCKSAAWLLLLLALAGKASHAGEPRAPGLNDLVILDPGVHERGLPGVVVNETEHGPKIDLPPIVHVHRYFYSGDKIYQGPILQGGRTIVVASHPKTSQTMNIEVMLPAGTPRLPTIATQSHTYTPISALRSNFNSFLLIPV